MYQISFFTTPTVILSMILGLACGVVYVSGWEHNGSNKVATLWINGRCTSLTDGSYDADAYSVFVSGNNVYVAGHARNF